MRISDQEFNRLRVLKTLRRAEPLCRTDLAKLSNLTGGTITEISGTLLDRALVVEEKVSSGKRGRPRVHLRINPAGGYALGAYIAIGGKLVCEIVDLKGEQVFLSSSDIAQSAGLEDMADKIADILERAITESPYDRSAITCVGLALPAVIDSRNGIIHWVQTLGSGSFPMAEAIAGRLGVPVMIDNNTNVLARAEHWFGEGDWLDDFTLVNLGYGISASHYVKGALAAGAHGLNSEMGHAKIVPEGGLPCTCGLMGCLDTYCSITGIVRQACTLDGIEPPGFPDAAMLLERYVAQASNGRCEIEAIFARAGTYLGIAMSNHINAFDPGKIIILSEHPSLPPLLKPAFLAAVHANCLPPFRGITQIEFRAYEQDLFRQGAAALVLEQVYRDDGAGRGF